MVTLSSEGGEGGLKLGITPRSDVGSSLPATSSDVEIFPVYFPNEARGGSYCGLRKFMEQRGGVKCDSQMR